MTTRWNSTYSMLNILLELNDFCLIIGDDNPEDIYDTEKEKDEKFQY